MSSGAALEVADAAEADFSGVDKRLANEKLEAVKGDIASDSEKSDILVGPNGERYPTEEEIKTLRRTYGQIPWLIYSIAFVEMCERFAYYGTTAVFVNFIQQPLPPGSTTGAGGTYEQAGALGLGQRASTGLTLFNAFWSYLMPLMGGYLADTYWGRFRTINYAIIVATFGHIILIVAAIPQVIAIPRGSLTVFIIGLIFFGIGVGWFKCNISPLIAEQYEAQHPRQTVETLKSGERVIVDPGLTISRIYIRFYWMINVGALIGPNQYGSVLSKSIHLFKFAMRGRWSLNPVTTVANMRAEDFWQRVKPSNVVDKPAWMTFDDVWVDEVRRGFKACTVFTFMPIFWLAYSQMTNNLVSQASTMRLGGVPNDILHNLNPFSLLILIPIFDKLFYPALAKMGLKFTPIKKIAMGFFAGCASMVTAAVIQHFIYVQSPCGDQASSCDFEHPLSVWVQTPAYVLIAISEIFASITGLEYAFTKAPKNMRGLVTGVFFLMNAFSSAIAQAFVGLSSDPLLVWLYATIAIISFIGGVGFWICFRKLDGEEDALNALPESTYKGRSNSVTDIEATQAEQKKQERIRQAQGLS